MSRVLSAVLVLLFLSACKYTSPLSEQPGAPIDTGILGKWQQLAENGHQAASVMILPYAETEYLIVYSGKEQDLYFRGYPLDLAQENLVQIRFIGTSRKRVEKENRKYDVVRYDAGRQVLSVALLNEDVIDRDLQTTAAMQDAFRRQSENENLFKKFGDFKRVTDTEP